MTNVDYKVRIPSIEDFDEEKGLFVLKEHINDIECTSLSYEIKNILIFERKIALMELKSQHSNKLGYGYFSNSTYYQNYYYHQGQISYDGDLLSSLYILPIIELSESAFDELMKDIGESETEITLGKYPTERIYNIDLKNSEAIYTKKSYTLPIDSIPKGSFKNMQISMKNFKEIEIDGQSYINYKYKNKKERTVYKVEPITWYIDREHKLLICKKLLLSGILYDSDYYAKKSFEDSNIYNFLNSTFLNELIFQHQEKKVENTSEALMKMPSDEITSLLNEIRLYAMYYHGKEDIEEIISTLLDKYNNDLNNLINNDGLVLYTEEGLHNNLILSLNTLLDKLKRNADNNLEYNRIIDYIDKCIDGLNGKISDSPSELYRDLCRINHDILLNLSSNTNKSEEIRSRIISLLSEDKKKIEEYLSYISTLTQGINLRLDTKTLPYKNISEYENYFRMRLHPILENILNISKSEEHDILIKSREEMLNRISDDRCNKDYINDVLRAIYKKIGNCNNNNNEIDLIKSNNKHINTLLKEISNEILTIMDMDSGITEELKRIVDIYIHTDNLNEIVNILNNILIELYKLHDKLNAKQEKVMRISKYFVQK